MPSDSSAQRVWDAALGRLQLRTPKATFDTWLAGTSGMAIADGQLTVSAPSTFAAEWLTKRMQALAGEAVSAIAGQPLSVSFVVGGGQPAVSTGPASGTRAGKAEGAPRTSRLHPEFTFDAFVAGPSNQLAFAAAQSITANPNSPYNPLFIYGGLGLGKTHLLQAIGQSAEAAGRSVLYASCEQFTNDYLTAMREKRTSDFRDRYWTVDLLLIDDIQVLIGKSPTIQEGFIHTFNALLMADRQLAVTCDRPASALPLDERLTSRLAVGLQADISSPDRETRLQMLTSFAALAQVSVHPDILAFMASPPYDSVRTLKGCFTQLTALAEFTGRAFSFDLARQALGPHFSPPRANLSTEATLSTVARYYGLPPSALTGPRRDKEASSARQMSMLLLHTLLGVSPEAIGALLGGRDRTTILYGLRRAAERIANSEQAASDRNALRELLTTEESQPGLSTSA